MIMWLSILSFNMVYCQYETLSPPLLWYRPLLTFKICIHMHATLFAMYVCTLHKLFHDRYCSLLLLCRFCCSVFGWLCIKGSYHAEIIDPYFEFLERPSKCISCTCTLITGPYCIASWYLINLYYLYCSLTLPSCLNTHCNLCMCTRHALSKYLTAVNMLCIVCSGWCQVGAQWQNDK